MIPIPDDKKKNDPCPTDARSESRGDARHYCEFDSGIRRAFPLPVWTRLVCQCGRGSARALSQLISSMSGRCVLTMRRMELLAACQEGRQETTPRR